MKQNQNDAKQKTFSAGGDRVDPAAYGSDTGASAAHAARIVDPPQRKRCADAAGLKRSITTPFMRVGDVAVKTGLSIREVWRRSRSDPAFPNPRKLSMRVTVWVEQEVEDWVQRVIAA